MHDFMYYAPTKVVFGRDAEKKVGELCKEQGAKKVLVHFGGGSAERSGLLARVYASLGEAGIPYVPLGGVKPNPRLSLVREGIELCQKEGVDFLLAVGGGSVIDSAKAIGYGLASGGDVWDFYAGKRKPTAKTPVGVVLTLAAAGSEMSNSSVITSEESGEPVKRGYNDDILGRAAFAVMNPALTITTPAYHTAAGNADILMHTMERYFTNESSMELTDAISEALMRTVIAAARTLSREPDNYDARANVMWASSLSHNGLTSCGGTLGDWVSHQLSHQLSAKYDAAHGAAITMVWGSWARYVYKANPARFARFAENVLELPREGDDEAMALAGIEEMEGFFWAIELPTSMEDAGLTVTDEDIAEMAKGFSRNGTRTVGAIKPIGEEDAIAIYKAARFAPQD